jgi:hypothetical protein
VSANIRVIRTSDFVRAKPSGEYNLEETEQLLAEIAHAVGAQDLEILVDTRSASGKLSATDLWSLAQTLVKHRQAFSHKTAVLCPQHSFDNARFFSYCAEYRGFNVQAFLSYEEAMEWLIESAA